MVLVTCLEYVVSVRQVRTGSQDGRALQFEPSRRISADARDFGIRRRHSVEISGPGYASWRAAGAFSYHRLERCNRSRQRFWIPAEPSSFTTSSVFNRAAGDAESIEWGVGRVKASAHYSVEISSHHLGSCRSLKLKVSRSRALKLKVKLAGKIA